MAALHIVNDSSRAAEIRLARPRWDWVTSDPHEVPQGAQRVRQVPAFERADFLSLSTWERDLEASERSVERWVQVRLWDACAEFPMRFEIGAHVGVWIDAEGAVEIAAASSTDILGRPVWGERVPVELAECH